MTCQEFIHTVSTPFEDATVALFGAALKHYNTCEICQKQLDAMQEVPDGVSEETINSMVNRYHADLEAH